MTIVDYVHYFTTMVKRFISQRRYGVNAKQSTRKSYMQVLQTNRLLTFSKTQLLNLKFYYNFIITINSLCEKVKRIITVMVVVILLAQKKQ